MRLERGREHRAHGDVAGADRVGAQHLRIAVGADAQAHTGCPQRGKLRRSQRVQVFLAEVHAVGAGVDRGLPVVVDEEQAAVPRTAATAASTSRRISSASVDL
jgi:hypothetical protein